VVPVAPVTPVDPVDPVDPVEPVGPVGPMTVPAGPVAPVAPVAPLGPAGPFSRISSVAGWLVVALSLLSKVMLVAPGLAVRMNPSFGLPFNHAFTWLVTSTVMYTLAVVMAMPVWIGAPGPGIGFVVPFTVLSDHIAFAGAISIPPGVVTLLTKNRSRAEVTLLPVTPAGNLVRSNNSNPWEFGASPILMPGNAP
jgi:hypothetical protein